MAAGGVAGPTDLRGVAVIVFSSFQAVMLNPARGKLVEVALQADQADVAQITGCVAAVIYQNTIATRSVALSPVFCSCCKGIERIVTLAQLVSRILP